MYTQRSCLEHNHKHKITFFSKPDFTYPPLQPCKASVSLNGLLLCKLVERYKS